MCRVPDMAELFDHLVGAGEQRRGESQGECFCRLLIDQEFKFGRLINWNVSRFGAFQDFVHVIGQPPEPTERSRA